MNLSENVSTLTRPKNNLKGSFIIDMHNLSDTSKGKMRKVPTIQFVFKAVQSKTDSYQH